MPELLAKLEKKPSESKKWLAMILGSSLLAICFGLALYLKADTSVLWILAFFLGAVILGYILGVAALETIVGKVLAKLPG